LIGTVCHIVTRWHHNLTLAITLTLSVTVKVTISYTVKHDTETKQQLVTYQSYFLTNVGVFIEDL